MKHIGWCLERIQIVMAPLPSSVISQEDKDKANAIHQEQESMLGQIRNNLI